MARMDRHERRSSRAARVTRTWLVSMWVATHTGSVGAQPREEAVRLQYLAPTECPDVASFERQVRERTPNGRFAEPSELARTFNVRLQADQRGYSGEVDFVDDNGTKVSRQVHGEQCDAVVGGLALITALALDATLRSQDSEPSAPTTQVAEAPPSPPEPKAQAPTPSEQSHSHSVASERWLEAVRVGVLAGYGNAVSAPRLGFLGQLDFRSGLAVRLSAHYAAEELAVDPGRSARLRRLGLETSVCPWSLRRGALSLAPCVAVDLGSLRAAGVPSEQLTTTRAETLWWASLGAQLGLSWQPTARFWLELRAAAEFPLQAGHRFTFEDPAQTAYEVPALAGWGAFATGVRFW
jgi:hypothetical protein